MPTKPSPRLLSITMINWFEMHFADDPTQTVWGWNVDLALEIAASKPLESVSVANIKHFAETYRKGVARRGCSAPVFKPDGTRTPSPTRQGGNITDGCIKNVLPCASELRSHSTAFTL